MKYLIKYKLFESSSEEVKNYLYDIFLDIQDKEIEFDIDRRYIRTTHHPTHPSSIEELTEYKIIIGKKIYSDLGRSAKTFLLKDVYDSIQMAKSYMSDEGFFLVELRCGSLNKWGEVENFGLLYSFNLYEEGKCELVDKPLTYLEIDFRK